MDGGQAGAGDVLDGKYYSVLIKDMSVLRMFVNSAVYTVAILLGQAVVIPAMAYALSRFEFRGRDAIFFLILLLKIGRAHV